MEQWAISWEQAIQRVDPYQVLQRVLTAHRDDIIELNQEQLDHGVKSDGARLKSYTAPYAKWRKRKGLQIENTDFKVKNDFRKAMYAISTQMQTSIGSRDFKEK